jgi:hypothetical protein
VLFSFDTPLLSKNQKIKPGLLPIFQKNASKTTKKNAS